MKFDEYQIRLKKQYPNENLLLFEGGSNIKKPGKIKCLTCGKIYSFKQIGTPLKSSKKFLCKDCGKKQHIQNKFEQSLKDIFPNEPFEILKFKNTQTYGKIKCSVCGNVMEYQVINSLKKKKHICSNCFPNTYFSNRLQKTILSFENFINKSDQWEMAQSLNNIQSSDLIKCKCKKCGKNNYKTIYGYLKGIGCTCGRWDTKSKLIKSLGKEYKLLEPCTHSRNRVMIQHYCGYIYSINPHNFINGFNRCPKCKKNHSKGENAIIYYLKEHNIDYDTEVPCRIKNHLLRFDFYLPKYDLFIEYQGEQHYKEVDFFKTSLAQRQYYDQLKRDYCKEKLLEISYKEFDQISEILDSKVQRLS